MKETLQTILATLLIASIVLWICSLSESRAKSIQSGICKFVVRDGANNKVEYVKPCSEVEIEVN
jgi:hypothetical protein